MERLAWTLLHFLWQGAVIAAVYAPVRAFANRPNTRYLLGCAALLAMFVAPVTTWLALAAAAGGPASAAAGAFRAGVTSTTLGAMVIVPAQPHANFLPWIDAFWLAGVIAFSIRLAGGWVVAMRLRTRGVQTASAEWHALVRRIGISRPVRFLLSPAVTAPMVIGWLRPVVLMPVATLAALPVEQIEALLMHELAHIRRHDYLVNLFQSVAEALLFYHPAVWWISGHVRAERESCCDDIAVSLSGDVLAYATALAELDSSRAPHAAMAANGVTLSDRIARLLGYPRASCRRPALGAAVALVAVTAIAVFAQSGARPKFDAAVVKPSQEQRMQMVRPQPGRLTANASLKLLLQNAYSLQPFQIAGGPGWVESERYQIEATAGGNASRAQIFLMLQSLLEERFQLKVHRETRELPAYALMATKSPKLPAPKSGNCAPPPPDAPNEWAGGRMAPPGQGPSQLPRCGDIRVMLESSGARMQGGSVMMTELARTLSMVLARTVIDRTGYTAPFDIVLDFLPDQATSAMPPPPPGAAVDPNNPSIFAALQEQLGLRLESTKGPVDVLVIDHAERPAEN